MGFLTCGFTSSKYNCFVGWLFACFEGWATIFGVMGYSFFVLCMATSSKYLEQEYYALIGATIHISVYIFLFITDLIFKSDQMFLVGQSESAVGNMTEVTIFWFIYHMSIIFIKLLKY